MAATRKRGGRKRQPKPKAKGDQAVNGVLVRFEPGKTAADRDISIQPLGDVKKTEVPALLGIARRVAEADLGIGRG